MTAAVNETIKSYQALHASYEDLAEIVRHRFADATATLRELYARLVFNILCGNTDDHARNHAAFWGGETLRLTSAYDICPQGRTGHEASQAVLIAGDNRMSRISSCLDAAANFLLSRKEAIEIVEGQLAATTPNGNVGHRFGRDDGQLTSSLDKSRISDTTNYRERRPSLQGWAENQPGGTVPVRLYWNGKQPVLNIVSWRKQCVHLSASQ